MGEAFIIRRGGTSDSEGDLNLTVVGGTTQPTNPVENTIWVNTETPITSWICSATEPSGVPGMLWICTGTSSTVEFNALKKNDIQVCPLFAKQYVDDLWVDAPSEIYQDGIWKELKNRKYFFKEGVGSLVEWDVTKESQTSYTANQVKINFSTSNGYCTIFSKNSIDFSNYSTLYFELKHKASNSGDAYKSTFGVASAVRWYNDISWSAAASSRSTNRTIVAVDVSAITYGYLTYQALSSPDVYNIWAE